MVPLIYFILREVGGSCHYRTWFISSSLGKSVRVRYVASQLRSSWLPLWMRRRGTSPEPGSPHPTVPSGSFHFAANNRVHSSSWLSNTPVCIHTLSSSMYLLMGSWAIPQLRFCRQDWRQQRPAGVYLYVGFISFGYKPRSRLAGSWSRFFFNFVGSLQAALLNGWTSFHSHCQHTDTLFFYAVTRMFFLSLLM